jgi:uncharacterized protein
VITVVTDLNVTGKPAQFGRGVMADVAAKLIDQFAACLADLVRGPSTAEAAAAAGAPAGTAPSEAGTKAPAEEGVAVPGGVATEGSPRPPTAPQAQEAVDLLGVFNMPMAKQLAPLLSGLVLGLVLGGLLGRRRPFVIVVPPATWPRAAR